MTESAVRPPDLPVTFRPVVTRVVLLTTGAAVFGVLALIAALLPTSGAAAWRPGERIAVATSGLIVWAVLALLSRPRVTADRDGLTVVNLTTTRRLAWAEIVRVTLRPGDPWVTLDLADGTVLAVMAIQPGVSRRRAMADARALRALAETCGTAPADR
ncbi:PH domain-containing protein [Streptomyces litchfieldiae]|uniref:PH domain-containing protein n=1 Tax=Streptomyces litchfieldiae TaxID=3075543 RepID=A0ABU2MQ55_9ACTN|nr:PH domain-containing protein [Streptomyces sp. DSM 44938]MDT0343751.1 PH domain-containing protein [Streptomyces sp. DSM 44938]